MTASTPNPATFDRLLQVAVETFAERGFRDTTVREICTRANVNIASVNYYFRSKEILYIKALQFAFQEANRLHPQTDVLNKNLAPEVRLGFVIDNFLHKLLDDTQLGFHSKLIAREISNPTPALHEIMHSAIAPQCRLLEDLIVELVPNLQGNNTVISRCMLSILGQCLLFKHSRSVVDNLYPELIADEAAIQQCVQHITQFSLAALAAFARS
jgi:TetR/AcrR family transcriptional regulator, regulator of cefoperazone and chloramphenicol sensitivity